MRKKEVVGKTDYDLYSEEEADAFRENDRRMLEIGRKRHNEEWIFYPDGKKILLDTVKTPLLDSNGDRIGILGISRDITERKRIESELAEKEKFLSTVLKTTPDGFLVVDMNGNMIQVNDAYCTMSGYTAEEFVTLNIQDIDAVETPEETAIRINRIIANGSEIFETRHRRKDGQILHIEISVKYLDHNGGLLVCFCRDITRRKQAEESLRKSEERYRTLFTRAPISIIIHKLNDVEFIDINPAGLAAYGVSSIEELKAAEIWLDPPYSYEDALNWFRKTVQEGPQNLEWLIRKPNGELLWQHVFLSTININGMDRVLSCSINITKRKRMEEALSHEHERFAGILRGTNSGTWEWNVQTGETIFNERWAEIIGYTLSELSPVSIETWKKFCHPDDLQTSSDLLEKHFKGENEYYELEARLRHKNGEWVWVWDSGRVVTWTEDGKPLLMMGMHQDITNRKRAEEENQTLQEQLQQAKKLESIGLLAGGMAHYYNNMLSVIQGYGEMAQTNLTPDHPVSDHIKNILKAAHFSVEITKQLLAYARKQTIIPKEIDLNHQVTDGVDLLQDLVGESIQITWLPCDLLWKIYCDPTQIRQILVNVVMNARDAISEEGYITIETANIVFDESLCKQRPEFQPGEYVMLSITDNGCGMDRQTQERIFEPFFTTKGFGVHAGLGLSSVYGIVQQNKGYIHVYSELGLGSSFKIYLPRRMKTNPEPVVDTPPKPAQTGDETILVCDDQPLVMEVTQVMLEQLGYTVQTANTPREALELVRTSETEIHLLVTDVIMPEMNGTELAKRIVSMRPTIKTLYTSGYSADILTDLGLNKESALFISKLFSISDLAAIVRKALDSA